MQHNTTHTTLATKAPTTTINMAHPLNNGLSDLEKIRQSLSAITAIGSFDDVLATFGLLDMPSAQKYGIMFGFITFLITVIAVLALLTLGGTWKRIEEQAKCRASATAPDSITQRKHRALLMERLLDSRDWMMKTNYPNKDKERGDKLTPLTKMLMMEAPTKGEMTKVYEGNYKAAYRRCQDKPGGEFNETMCVLMKVHVLLLAQLTPDTLIHRQIYNRTDTRRSTISQIRSLCPCICWLW